MDNYYDIEEPEKKGFTIGKLLKWIVYGVMFLIIAILVVRCTAYQDDKIVKKVIVNDTLRAAYKMEDFAVEQYGMDNPWIPVQDRRMVEFNYLYHIKAARQLQFSVKYNTDIVECLNEDGIPFKFKLVDNYSNVYEDYFFEQKEKFGYNYIRVCFEGIDLIDESVEPDEYGIPKRKEYTVYVYELGKDGEYTELCRYDIYDGSQVSKKIRFKLSDKK